MLRAHVAWIAKHPTATWGGGGDYIDAIIHTDKRFRASSVDKRVIQDDIATAQVELFLDIFTPIASRCLYLAMGNHEDVLQRNYGYSAYNAILRGIAAQGENRLADLALGWGGFVKFRIVWEKETGAMTGKTIMFYVHHGSINGRKKGAIGLRAEEVMQTYEADLYFMGHRHNRDIITKVVVRSSGKGSVLHRRICVWGGSYMHPYNPRIDGLPTPHYADAKQLPPEAPGCVPVLIMPDGQFTPVIGDDPMAILDGLLGD